MDKKKVNEHLSTFLVQPLFVAVILVGGLIANYVNLNMLSAFLFVTGLLFLLSYFWAGTVLRNIRVKSDGRIHTCYPGDTVTVSYEIRNEKWIPMLWLHFLQKPMEDCIAFPEDMSRGELRFGRLLWYGNVRFDVSYKAVGRGVYPISQITVRSGDGFGLTQQECIYDVTPESGIVVYPRLCPVNTEPFLKNLWWGASGRNGYVEDLTLLRSTRDYETTDSWKRIDWRSAARGGELQTKLYETVKPQGVHFILDMERPCSEQVISVIASLIVELDEKQISCGLSLPKTVKQPAFTSLPAGTAHGETETLLIKLAEFDQKECEGCYDVQPFLHGLQTATSIWIFYCSGQTLNCMPLLEKTERNMVTLVDCRNIVVKSSQVENSQGETVCEESKESTPNEVDIKFLAESVGSGYVRTMQLEDFIL